MIKTANLGCPRIGENRELKKALEKAWKGKIGYSDLIAAGSEIKKKNWESQKEAGIDLIPSNDFSLYDHVLDTAFMFNIVPQRFEEMEQGEDLDLYFAMARGAKKNDEKLEAMEMTKWFNTNYHYIVPELEKSDHWRLRSNKPLMDYKEAKSLGLETHPVILGPVSFLLLGKTNDESDPLKFLNDIVPLYKKLMRELEHEGVEWIWMEEPCLVYSWEKSRIDLFKGVYEDLSRGTERLDMMLVSYFSGISHQFSWLKDLPVQGLHLDLASHEEQLESFMNDFDHKKVLSLGLINGKNVWKADLKKSFGIINKAESVLGSDNLIISPSCSFMFVPYDMENEPQLDSSIKKRIAFFKQKIRELAFLKKYSGHADSKIMERELLDTRIEDVEKRLDCFFKNDKLRCRLAQLDESDYKRADEFTVRKKSWREGFNLPVPPSTTIGSFPQTKEIRSYRRKFKKNIISKEEYDQFIKNEISKVVRFQEEIELDVFVHGEPERTDMVEYFAENLEGFVITENGWVQSYGSRCVRPPIIAGDVIRNRPLSVNWAVYAQSLTHKPVKGMLTGPVTILKWSFPREDQPLEDTCLQIALAIRDETLELEEKGIRVIQIDEPAFREGLPFREKEKREYLKWAVDSFLLASSGVKNSTQIHTHMCYSEFNEMIDAIARMDADVISIESSRSKMELLNAFHKESYRNDIGPGIYDIHSPRIPGKDEMKDLIRKAINALDIDQIWINPDCGLKTRDWAEVKPSLRNMMEAVKEIRDEMNDL